MAHVPQRKDITGQRFNSLEAIEYSHTDERRRAVWRFRCDCGAETLAPAIAVRYGHNKSCGCKLRETLSRGRFRHGMSGTPAWVAWRGAIARCKYPNNPRYKNYGGRGIKVCERWQAFENFIADMGEPSPGMTLERINVDGDYEPGNCRWAEASEQYVNKTVTVFVEIHGVRVPFAVLVRASGVKNATAWARIYRYGWTAERAFPGVNAERARALAKPEQLHERASRPSSQPRP